MFMEAPFVSLLIIGIPVSIISLICYCLCCSSSDNSSSKTKNSKKKRKNGQVEPEEDEQNSGGEDDDEEYEERIVQVEPRFIENFVKPADARDIPTWPIMTDDSQKPMIEKKKD
ncbi:unnamed protein product [Rotaria socialis]|nr:unnamed protein product [Rotaria socialis]